MGSKQDLVDLRKWADIIMKTSRCGLGKTSNNFILDAIEKFPAVMESNITETENLLEKNFSLEESVLDYADFVTKYNTNGQDSNY